MEEGQHTQHPAQNGQSSDEIEIGRSLEQRRKEKGLSFEEVEQATKIRKRYLAGLERADYDVLPDGVYAQGFLKTYANYLGLDGETLSRQLKSRRKPHREPGINYNTEPESGFEEPLISPRGVRGTGKRKFATSALVTLLVAVLALSAVIGALYFVGRGVQATRSGGEPEGANPPPAQPAENQPSQDGEEVADAERAAGPGQEDIQGGETNATDGEAVAGSQQNVPPDTLQVSINVQERPSWLLIRTDGTVAYEQVAQPGFSETFETDRRLYIKAGDAGAVNVEVNGQDAGRLGRTGYIVDRTYTLKSAG